ncbi:MAG: MATE family efflux transporter, partial [Clostridiales bacterium]|nr:MATE family efflux transporter [Clostridiales bacterium]
GISQGMQPITGFNYGAKNYGRVKNAYLRSIACCFVIGIAATIIYECFPHQLMALFGAGSDEYFEFGVRYLRIFLCLAFVNFLPTFSSNFFTSIGKPGRGMFLSMSRQIIYFLPLLIILPLFMGIEGVFYVGPIADAVAVVTTAIFVARELRDKKYTQPCD